MLPRQPAETCDSLSAAKLGDHAVLDILHILPSVWLQGSGQAAAACVRSPARGASRSEGRTEAPAWNNIYFEAEVKH